MPPYVDEDKPLGTKTKLFSLGLAAVVITLLYTTLAPKTDQCPQCPRCEAIRQTKQCPECPVPTCPACPGSLDTSGKDKLIADLEEKLVNVRVELAESERKLRESQSKPQQSLSDPNVGGEKSTDGDKPPPDPSDEPLAKDGNVCRATVKPPTLEEALKKVKPLPHCHKMVESAYGNTSNFNSQWSQDWFIWMNYLHDRPTGFYLDIGASKPVAYSNSYFFDVCLGWKGICVEPSHWAKHYAGAGRTCEVINGCIYSATKKMDLGGAGSMGASVRDVDSSAAQHDSKKWVVQCHEIDNVLRERGIKKVDFMSLDVEGAELHALAGWPDEKEVQIDVVVMENNRGKTNGEDEHTKRYPLLQRDYHMVHHLLGDDVFVKSTVPELWRTTIVRPEWAIQWEGIDIMRQVKNRSVVDRLLGRKADPYVMTQPSYRQRWRQAFGEDS